MKTNKIGNGIGLNNPLKIKDRKEAVLKKRYCKLKYRHKKVLKSEKEVICFRQFKMIFSSKCFYCNSKHSFVIKDISENNYGEKISDTIVKCNGIDRIDSSKGYTKGNVVTCCKNCNVAKAEMSTIEFYKYCLTVSGRINNFSMIKNKLKNRKDSLEISRRFSKLKIRQKELNKRNKRNDEVINKDEFENIISKPCNYCKTNWTSLIVDTGTKFNGIDRIDSSKGYIKGNIVPCCFYCNVGKAELSIKNFFRMINRIIKKMDKKNGKAKK
jgi:hypothetical protein